MANGKAGGLHKFLLQAYPACGCSGDRKLHSFRCELGLGELDRAAFHVLVDRQRDKHDGTGRQGKVRERAGIGMPRLDRGRAAPDQIEDRIARNAQFADFGRDCRLIDSGGVLEQAGDALVTLILKAASDRR